MGQPRPRRALRPPLAVRVARVAVPSVLVGVLGVGVALATWPGDETQIAYPAPAVAAPAADVPRVSTEPNLRRMASPSPTVAPSAARKPTAKPSAKPKAKPVAKAKPVVKAKPKPEPEPKPEPIPTPALKVVDSKYVTVSLNVRTAPDFDADVVDVVSAGDKVSVTEAVHNGFRYISYNDRGRWISNRYLSDSKPKVASTSSSGGGVSSASCSKSSAIESGLVPNAIKVYRSLCDRYPAISSFGGRRSGDGGFHGTGQAVDVMISDSSVGWDIAEWTRANASALGVSEVLYAQKIWTVERGSEGWRPMSDRGSASANHYDHVHVSVY